MEKQTLMGRVKRAVSQVALPVAQQLTKGAVAAVEAVTELEGKLESKLRNSVKSTPVVQEQKAAPNPVAVGTTKKARPILAAAKRISPPGPKAKRGQKHSHSH